MVKPIKKLLLQDNRKTDRLTLPLKVWFCLPFETQWHGPVSLNDISGNGLQFTSSTLIEKNSQLRLKVDLQDSKKPIIIPAEVIWSKKLHIPKTFTIGVKFIAIPEQDNDRFVEFLCDHILLAHINNRGDIT